MLRIWLYLSTRPRALKCAVIVCGILFGCLCGWIAAQGTGVPMEWPQCQDARCGSTATPIQSDHSEPILMGDVL